MEGKLTHLFVVFLFLGPIVAALDKRLKGLPKCAGKNALLRKYEETFKIKSSGSSVGKRELSWPISCLHVAIVKDENNNPYFSLDIHGCCNKCQFPRYTFCMWTGNPDWLCASEAYDCIFQCRQETPASAPSRGKKKPKMSAAEKSKKLKRREEKCFRIKKCKNKKQCCWRYRCLPLAQLLRKAKKV